MPKPNVNYGNLSTGPGAPVIAFTAQPNAAQTVATNLVPNPSIIDQDAQGTPRVGDLVTLSLTPGSGPGALSCDSPLAQTTGPSGQLTWVNCQISQSGNYGLRATTTTGNPGDSSQFVVSGVPTHLAVISSPAASTPTTLTPQLSFGIYDASNNLVAADTRNVSLSSNLSPGTFSCPGGLTKAAVGGVATFPGCTQTTPASGYQITATSSPVLTPAVTPLFTVTSPVASKLQLCWGPAAVCNTTPPSPNTPAIAFSTQPTVRVQDAGGNTITTDNSTVVSLAITPGTPTSGGPGALSCTGGLSATVVAGIATFANCAISTAGVGYMLTATSTPVLTASTSAAFNVGGVVPTKLGFVVQPTSTATNVPFPANVVVAIQDVGGATVTTGISATIALTIGANPGSSSLSCTGGNTAVTVSGLATFTGCSLNNPGTGYTLVATAISTTPVTVLTAATSAAFNVTSAVTPASIVVSASAPTITWASTVVISVHFATNGANRTFRLEGARDPNSPANFALIANLTTNATGDATFAYTPPTNLYYRAVFAGAVDLGAATSPLTRVVVRQIAILRPTNNGGVNTINKGTAITFTTTVRPSRPELTPAVVVFTVFQLKNGTWVQVLARNVTATGAGIAQLKITFSTPGSFYVRSQANPTPYNANSVNSPLQRYDVNS